ncbi:MAG: tripartite tricarboxylate transporter TctB family protein [Rhodospirillales bacterium]|nr:tripartite tricarboxylate transporter TctB family protein [Rhodospirillales bacterium]
MPYVLVAAASCGLASLFFISSLTMQPAAYQMPRLLVALVFILTAAMLIDYAVQKRRKAAGQPLDEVAAPLFAPFFQGASIPRVAIFLGAVILYVVLLEPLGYFIVTPLFLLGTLLYLRACRLMVAAAIAAVAPVFVYFIFVWLLDLPVPMGIME